MSLFYVFLPSDKLLLNCNHPRKGVYLSSILSSLIFSHGMNSFFLCVSISYARRQASKQSQKPASSHVFSQFPLFFRQSVSVCAALFLLFFSSLVVVSGSGTVISSNKKFFCSDSCLLFVIERLLRGRRWHLSEYTYYFFSFCSVYFIQPQLVQ